MYYVTQSGQNFRSDTRSNTILHRVKLGFGPVGIYETTLTRLGRTDYTELFEVFVKHSDKVARVSTWGTVDSESWKNGWPVKGRTNYPLLFDRNYSPKEAYHSIINLAS